MLRIISILAFLLLKEVTSFGITNTNNQWCNNDVSLQKRGKQLKLQKTRLLVADNQNGDDASSDADAAKSDSGDGSPRA